MHSAYQPENKWQKCLELELVFHRKWMDFTIENWKKSKLWEPFWIYQLIITWSTHSTHSRHVKLAELISWLIKILGGNPHLFVTDFLVDSWSDMLQNKSWLAFVSTNQSMYQSVFCRSIFWNYCKHALYYKHANTFFGTSSNLVSTSVHLFLNQIHI